SLLSVTPLTVYTLDSKAMSSGGSTIKEKSVSALSNANETYPAASEICVTFLPGTSRVTDTLAKGLGVDGGRSFPVVFLPARILNLILFWARYTTYVRSLLFGDDLVRISSV